MVASLRSFDIMRGSDCLVLFVLLACKWCWFLLVALVLVLECSVVLVLLWGLVILGDPEGLPLETFGDAGSCMRSLLFQQEPHQ